jgi:hypothetical protein
MIEREKFYNVSANFFLAYPLTASDSHENFLHLQNY